MSSRVTSSDNGGFRYLALAEMLQKDIESGKYAVGAKLPSERFLAKQLNVSHLTVRQGVDVLARKGMIRRELGSGTYVTATKVDPIIGILFGPSLVDESAHYYRALLKALEAEIIAMDFTCRSYDGFNRTEVTDAEDCLSYKQLLRDTQSHSVHGFIQVSVTDERWNNLSPIKGVPKSTSGETNRDLVPEASHFIQTSFKHCVETGCKDIVYLRTYVNPLDDLGGLGDCAKRMGVPMPEVINLEDNGQPLDVIGHDLVGRLCEEWRRIGRRPDAMIISDDIVTRGVAIALIKAGIKVPSEMKIVTLANEGIDHHYGIEVVRYTISSRDIARRMIKVLQLRMKGKNTITPTAITGVLKDDKPRGRSKRLSAVSS